MDKGVGGGLCRVSTDDQSELSLESQELAVRQLLEREGYSVPDWAILKTDWTSLDLMSCPEFQELRGWILNRRINAIGVFDRDRLQAQGLQRLVFLSECQENGVKVLTVQGPPMTDSAEGQLVELALVLGKERSVQRAQQGARDGLRDRAALRGLPVIPVGPYGYVWDGAKFRPDASTFPVAQRIWQLASEGTPIRTICRRLGESGISSPSGRPHWAPSTIARILDNPIYRGDYVALRKESIEPSRRRGHTYGKSSYRVRDEREQIPIPGLVSEPAVSPEDFERVQRRLARNKASGGQVRQYYLLRGLVNCGSCGRNWRGKRRKGGRKVYYRYLCRGKESQNGKRCDHPSIDGPRLEDRVWKRVVAFLTQPELFFTAIEGQEGHSAKIADQLSTSIKRLERRLETVGDALARAYRGYAKGVVSEETYRRVDSEFQAERTWIEQELARQREELRGAERQVIDADAVRMLYPRVVEHIESASPQDKRFVLECLDAVIRIEPEMVSLSVAVPDGDVSSVSSPPGSGEGSPPIRR